MAPVIGITATLKEDPEGIDTRPLGGFVRADLDYVEGVARAGGAPIVLPPIVEAAGSLVESIDGLLLSGGSDLDPSYYDEKPVPEMGVTIPERDEFEMALLGYALERGIPVFGICRGLQILNVALGGSLYQDLPTQFDAEGTALEHRQNTPKRQPTHEVEVDAYSRAGKTVGSRVLKVNSYHHQAVKDLADGLVVCGRSPDGVVEAVEARNFPEQWLLAVQWHAEAMRESGQEHRSLFEAHVEAARRHSLRRAAA